MGLEEITVPLEGTDIRCSQCDHPAPADTYELGTWRHSVLITNPVDDLTIRMLLCPACLEEDHNGEYDSGEGD